VFFTTVGDETTILFKDTAGFSGDRVTGAVTAPSAGGTHRPDGGRFAVICGRPYRLDSTALSTNVETILSEYLLEPYEPVASAVDQTPDADLPMHLSLGANYPNPFNPQTIIPFSLPRNGFVSLGIYDPRGRMVKELTAGQHPAGSHSLTWNGTDTRGLAVPSGMYFVRLKGDTGVAETRSIMLVR